MKKLAFTLGLWTVTVLSHAADPLNGTLWKIMDAKTKQPKTIVKFTEFKNGTLNGNIQSILTSGEENACKKCEGPYHNKSLKGLIIVYRLKNVGGQSYEGWSILDPQSGKTYKLKAEIVDGGKKLNLRGYSEVAVLGLNQTWIRVN